MSSKNNNILFYKTKCELSYKFMDVANKVGILKSFNLICIDGREDFFIKEKGLRYTPTIIMRMQNIKLENTQCLDWLRDFIISQNNTSTNTNTNPQQDINVLGSENFGNNNNDKFVSRNNIIKRGSNKPDIKNISNNNNNNQTQPTVVQINNQLIGYTRKEMSGYSDEYAYLACDNPMPKSFLPPTSDFQIYTAPENGKIDKQKQNIYVQNLENKREEVKNNIMAIQKSQHKNFQQNGSGHKWFDESHNH